MHESLSQYSPRQLSRYRTIALACALLAFLIGGAALLGWVFNNELLKRVHPSLVTMKPNTAVCLILVSLSLLLLRNPLAPRWRRRIGQLFAVLVALIAVASFWASDDKPREWSKEEVSLLQTVAERTWTAIEKLRGEAERERLLHSEKEARDVAEKANQPSEMQHEHLSPATAPLRLALLRETDFLIVDDSEDTIAMLDQFLKISGANVTSATNGADALRLAREKEFGVILSDISMPEMDGFEFLQRLRQIDGRQAVPVVAITGFGRSADVERARTAGFFSHLTKPLDLEALALVLEQLTDNNGKS